MDLSLRTQEFAAEDQSWLASAHGTNSARTITLDHTQLDAAVDSDGVVKSGTPLARLANGKYALYVPNDSGNRDTLAGFLLTTVSGADKGDVFGALLDHGKVISELCPNFTYDGPAGSDVKGAIIFVDQPPAIPDDESSSSSA